MDLSNAFTVLHLDAEDDQNDISSCKKSFTTDSNEGSSSRNANGLVTSLSVGNGEHNEKHLVASSSVEYRMPLVWIDLEMTGLNIEVDTILEIACIITDGNLTKSIEHVLDLERAAIVDKLSPSFGPNLVIHQNKECLEKMGEWCQTHHADSGLTERVLQSTVSEREAEYQVIEFVKRHVGTHTPLLAGNSVYVDFLFLKKYMPDLASLFSHVVVDVSSVKALCIRWFPKDHRKAPSKENKHRAMDDIRESIKELKYYKDNIFKAKSKK